MGHHEPEASFPHAEIAAPNGPVTIDLDRSGNGPRLRLEAKALDQVVFLDPLELEALTWAPEELFEADPVEAGAAPSGSGSAGEAPSFSIEIANEFARVTVELDHAGEQGTTLKIGAARLHRVLRLDAGQLEALTGVESSTFESLLATPFGPEADDVVGERAGEVRG